MMSRMCSIFVNVKCTEFSPHYFLQSSQKFCICFSCVIFQNKQMFCICSFEVSKIVLIFQYSVPLFRMLRASFTWFCMVLVLWWAYNFLREVNFPPIFSPAKLQVWCKTPTQGQGRNYIIILYISWAGLLNMWKDGDKNYKISVILWLVQYFPLSLYSPQILSAFIWDVYLCCFAKLWNIFKILTLIMLCCLVW
jgi:hypothetical protein